jgi:hypothetical protein
VNSTIPADLLALKEQFDSWRQSRPTSRTPIPDDLWQTAISLLRLYPASTIGGVCRLHPAALKKRAAAALTKNSSAQPRGLSKEAFFQIKTADLQKDFSSPCRLQIERPDGSRLTLFLPTLDSSTISALCAGFLRAS